VCCSAVGLPLRLHIRREYGERSQECGIGRLVRAVAREHPRDAVTFHGGIGPSVPHRRATPTTVRRIHHGGRLNGARRRFEYVRGAVFRATGSRGAPDPHHVRYRPKQPPANAITARDVVVDGIKSPTHRLASSWTPTWREWSWRAIPSTTSGSRCVCCSGAGRGAEEHQGHSASEGQP